MERVHSDIGEGVGFPSGSCRVHGGKSVTRGEHVKEITKEMSDHCHELKLLTERDIDVMIALFEKSSEIPVPWLSFEREWGFGEAGDLRMGP